MKLLNIKLFMVIILAITVSSCTIRLVDFTVISTKNAEIGVDKTKAVQTEGKKSYIFNMGFNLKDALDDALENAGPKYDLLVDGVVLYTSYPFVTVVKVKGLAVSSTELRAELGEEGYRNWCESNNIFDPENPEVIE